MTVLRVLRRLLLLLLTACMHRMYLFPRFLDPERAEHVVQMARSRLAPSALALRKGDKEAEKMYVRMCPLTGTESCSQHTPSCGRPAGAWGRRSAREPVQCGAC